MSLSGKRALAALLCSEEAGRITLQLVAGFPLEIQGSLRKKTAAAK
jgi:hypothetical protein